MTSISKTMYIDKLDDLLIHIAETLKLSLLM